MEPCVTWLRTVLGRRTRLLALASVLLATVAMACHVDYRGHLGSIHLGIPGLSDLEYYCIQDEDLNNAPTVSEAAPWIDNALWGENGGYTWEIGGPWGVNGIDFAYLYRTSDGSRECADLTQSDYDKVHIFFHLCTTCPGLLPGTTSDVSQTIFDEGSVVDAHSGQNDYKRVHVHLSKVDLYYFSGAQAGDFRRHIINHETGHTFGLADPDPGSHVPGVIGPTRCQIEIDTTGDGLFDRVVGILSIMHNNDADNGVDPREGHCRTLGVGDLPWPSTYDLLIENLIAHKDPLVQ